MRLGKCVAIATIALGLVTTTSAVYSGAANAATSCSGSKIYSAPLTHGSTTGPGTVNLYWNGSTSQNCAMTVRTGAAAGVYGTTSVTIKNNSSGKSVNDTGNYKSYAGPVSIVAPGCITLSASLAYKGVTYTFSKSGWCSGSTAGSSSAGSSTCTSSSSDVWCKLAYCESGNRNISDSPYYGYFQFTLSTWHSVGATGSPTSFSYSTQRSFAIKLQARDGWGQWPVCSKQIGV